MPNRRHLLGAGAAFALLGCVAGPEIQTEVDPGADFSGYLNYTWAYATPQPGVDPQVWEHTRDAIDRTLQRRGFVKADPAQFAVGFTLGSREEIRADALGQYYAAYRDFGRVFRGRAGAQVPNVTQGTLTIDVFDVATGQPAWHGTTTQPIRSTTDQAAIDSAVAAVLAKFPPR